MLSRTLIIYKYYVTDNRKRRYQDDARALAALAHRTGASGELVDRWYSGPPPPAEPEAEPEPR